MDPSESFSQNSWVVRKVGGMTAAAFLALRNSGDAEAPPAVLVPVLEGAAFAALALVLVEGAVRLDFGLEFDFDFDSDFDFG